MRYLEQSDFRSFWPAGLHLFDLKRGTLFELSSCKRGIYISVGSQVDPLRGGLMRRGLFQLQKTTDVFLVPPGTYLKII
jgi:hypothetical protein